MAVMRWDPFAQFDRLLDTAYGREGGRARRGMPMDIYRTGDRYVVEMELPGVQPDDIDINLERNTLTVNAETQSHHEDADEVMCERSHAHMSRQLYLGDDIDADHVEANFDKGVLTVTVPIAQQAGGRKIGVGTAGGGAQTIEAASPDESEEQRDRS